MPITEVSTAVIENPGFVGNVPTVAWLWFAGLLIQTIIFTAVGTWWVSRVIAAIRKEIATERKEIDHIIAGVENEFRDKLTGVEADGRQMVASVDRVLMAEIVKLKDQVHENELHARDNYVRRGSFYEVTKELKELIGDGISNLRREVADGRREATDRG